MSIKCKICNTDFDKIIPWQHLRIHNISTAEYKKQYGEVYSQETLDKFSARTPHNKGKKVTDPIALANQRKAIQKREERYNSGELERTSGRFERTEEQRMIASRTQSNYAANNPDIMKIRTQTAIQTKIDKNYDFGASMRDKHHSAETKTCIREIALLRVQDKTILSHDNIHEKLAQLNISLVNDINNKQLELNCNSCHTNFSFTKQYFTASKFKENMCPTCFPRNPKQSKGEIELYQFIATLAPDAISGYRESYHSKEIDVFIPSKNIGFEYNGLYWHSEQVLTSLNKSPKSDFEKQQYFANQNIQLITIFEDEWLTQQAIVKSRIASILGKITNKIYARKCQIKEVSSKDAAAFCKTNHIMRCGRSNIRVGLYYQDELTSIMTFTNNNISRKLKDTWEINRFASLSNTTVVGGASKLFAYFVNKINPTTVISYADNRWSLGNLYQRLNFVKTSSGAPNYWYFLPNEKTRTHRFNLRKTKDDDQNLTECENRTKQGYLRIWDCGSSKWEWTNDPK